MQHRLLLASCYLLLASPALADELPDRVVIRIGAKLTLDTIAVHLPDGATRVLGTQPREELDLPPGTEVELVEGDRRRYEGHLVAEQRDDGTVVFLEIPVESYLAGVLVSEIGAATPAAALEAQAVVSRTLLALGRDRHPGDPWTLCDLTHCQSFRGITDAEAPRRAVEATRDRVLTVLGRVVEAPFHSTCGGQTLSSREVWGSEDAEHLSGVLDLGPDGTPWCAASPHQQWRAAVLDDGLPDPRTDPDRFRTAVGRAHGWNLVKSNRFTATLVSWKGATVWRVEGVGLGHGVGLCQRGAIGRALAGMGADEILVAYYSGAVATKVAAGVTPGAP